MRTIIGLLGVAALVLTGGPAGAQAPPPTPCDFVTGGGTITTDSNVNWAVKVSDNAEAGKGHDTFMIKVAGGSLTYTSGDHTLTGGNIQLHQPNGSGFFSGAPTPLNCPAFVPPTSTCNTNADCPAGTDEVCVAGACVCPTGTSFDPVAMRCCQGGICGD